MNLYNIAFEFFKKSKGKIQHAKMCILIYYDVMLDLNLINDGSEIEFYLGKDYPIPKGLDSYFVEIDEKHFLRPKLEEFKFHLLDCDYLYKTKNKSNISKEIFPEIYPDSEVYSFYEGNILYKKVNDYIKDKDNYNYIFFGTLYKLLQNKELLKKIKELKGYIIDGSNILPSNNFGKILTEIKDFIL